MRVIQKVNGKMLVNVGEEVFNDLFQSQSDFFIRYDVDDKPYAIYHRIKNPASFRPYKYMMNTWSSQGNKLHIDFEVCVHAFVLVCVPQCGCMRECIDMAAHPEVWVWRCFCSH